MSRLFFRIGVSLVVSAAGFAQTANSSEPITSPVSFEAADVHPSAHVTNPFMRGGVLRSGRYDVRTASLLDLISNAWGVDRELIMGGPSWLEIERFDISAKAPANTPPDKVKLMLQSLLVDRWGVKVHNDTRPVDAMVLLQGKGKPKLKESEGEGSSECRFVPQTQGTVPSTVLSCRHRTMEQFATDIRNFGGSYSDLPVRDMTRLDGAWDFDFRFTPRGQLSRAGADGITLFDALDKQLGLRLEARKAPTPVLVVDSANRRPTPNPVGVSVVFPPPPDEFEVATIKPSRPGEQPYGRIEHGRVDVQNIPLKDLIEIAWDINVDDLVANLPKFAETENFDVTAKAPATPSGEIDFEDLTVMFRKLLAERFNLKAHMEERPVEGYVLTAVKPKMAKADPSNRTRCKEGPGADGKDARIEHPILSRLVTCHNMTMAEFVEMLPNLAGGYAHVDVLDSTGLTGAYDFTLSFSAVGLVKSNPIPGQQAPGTSDAADPSGALSLPDAVSRELGLKLELKKRPMQVLVVDHVDEKPTEN